MRAAIADDKWLEESFITRVQKRGEEVINLRKLSSAASAANAVCDHVRTLFSSEPSGVHSMGVIAENKYGVSKDICFSFPVVCCKGEWTLVEGLGLNERLSVRLKATEKELLEEKDVAEKALN